MQKERDGNGRQRRHNRQMLCDCGRICEFLSNFVELSVYACVIKMGYEQRKADGMTCQSFLASLSSQPLNNVVCVFFLRHVASRND